MTAHDLATLETTIESAFEARDGISTDTRGEIRDAVEESLNLLDSGKARVAERQADGTWKVNQWLKKAVLLSFRLNPMEVISGGPGNSGWWDKVPSKFDGWNAQHFENAGFRAVPNCIVRRSAFVAKGVVLMPSFVNLGAYVDEGTMVDTWATVGSCAQIGKGVHLSGGVGIGGVLEPMQAGPTIIEDNCFIGARSEVVEGCIVREGSVLGMGVYIGKSTKIVDRATGEKLVDLIRWWEDYTARNKGSMDNNPSPGNKKGGLTTILEKSLGAAAKGGTTPLTGVYKYAEPVTAKGFTFMDSPGYDPASVTGQIASGCNLVVFTTGRGSVFGCKPVPSLKLATNSPMYNRMIEDMDLNCGEIIDGTMDVQEMGSIIFQKILATASGELTKSEEFGFGDYEFAPWKIGAVL